MTRDVKIKVGWFSSEHRWKRKHLWISAENDWISMRAQPGWLSDCLSFIFSLPWLICQTKIARFLQVSCKSCKIMHYSSRKCNILARLARNARSWKILARDFWFVHFSCKNCLFRRSDVSLQDSFKKPARFFCTFMITPLLQDSCKYSLMQVILARSLQDISGGSSRAGNKIESSTFILVLQLPKQFALLQSVELTSVSQLCMEATIRIISRAY